MRGRAISIHVAVFVSYMLMFMMSLSEVQAKHVNFKNEPAVSSTEESVSYRSK